MCDLMMLRCYTNLLQFPECTQHAAFVGGVCTMAQPMTLYLLVNHTIMPIQFGVMFDGSQRDIVTVLHNWDVANVPHIARRTVASRGRIHTRLRSTAAEEMVEIYKQQGGAPADANIRT